MVLNSGSGDAKTRTLIVDMENNHSEVNEKSGEVSRDNPRGQTLEGKPLSTPSRKMFKNSRGFVQGTHAMTLKWHQCVSSEKQIVNR